jgi:hypothetical protein
MELGLPCLPCEIWVKIFESLDVESAMVVRDVCQYFRDVIRICRYDHIEVNMGMRWILNCDKYTIDKNFNVVNWSFYAFIRSRLPVSKYKEFCESFEVEFMDVVKGKVVDITDNRRFDYKLISGCSEVTFRETDRFEVPRELEGIDTVIIVLKDWVEDHGWMYNVMTDEEYDRTEEEEREGKYDLTYLRNSRSVEIVNAFERINPSTFSCLADKVECLILDKCYNVTDEHTEYFRNMKVLSLADSSITSTKNLENIESLNLAGTKIGNVDNLVNVKELNLESCSYLKEFGDVEMKAEYLNVAHCNVENFSGFHNLKELVICDHQDLKSLNCEGVEVTVEHEGLFCSHANAKHDGIH